MRTVRRALHHSELAVDAAMDGKEGLAAAKTNDYDVLLPDIMLPELDGLALLRRLRPLVETEIHLAHPSFAREPCPFSVVSPVDPVGALR